jgi:hypothetical protein
MNLDKKVNKLRNLPQYKNKTEEELELLAKQQLERDELLCSLTFALPEEKKWAQDLLEKYLAQSSLTSAAEKDTLKQLIDNSVLMERIKKYLNTEYNKPNSAIPLQMIEQVNELSAKIEELKDRLGLTQKKNEKNDVSKIISDLTERFHKWINRPENRCNYEFQCPKCEEIFLIRRRLDKEKDEIMEHPWFIEGGILFNKEIFIDLELGKISEDQARRYLNATLDYIRWIKTNYPINQDKEEVESDD